MAYSPPEFEHEITLHLSRNESRCVIDDLQKRLGQLPGQFVSRYPSHVDLQELIAHHVGVAPERRLVATKRLTE